MFDLEILKGVISKTKDKDISKEDIAKLLKTTPEALEAFEQAYHTQVIQKMPDTGNLFDMDAKSTKDAVKKKEGRRVTKLSQKVDELVSRIVKELLAQAILYSYDGSIAQVEKALCEATRNPVTNSDLCKLPESIRPQLTGSLAKIDVPDQTYMELLQQYFTYKKSKDPAKRKNAYHMFRQGLDILDLDPVTYEILGMNPNAMGYWFPELVSAVKAGSIFKLPKTKILKVPLTMLQLTRLDYGSLNPTTLRIVDEFCYKAFDLKEENEYFVKTGTYSSKFNFRNAHIVGAKEVRELGEYLLFIQNQACMAAGPLSQPCIYGMSTTNEWVVREYIKDKENNPCIYKGMPLHTEYRVFVDFDTDEILGMTPYWRSDIMKQRLGKHYNIAKRMVKRGGRRDVFLGARECQGFVEPCVFGEGASTYDSMLGEIAYGFMYHGITYADEAVLPEEKGKMTVNFWRPVIKSGGIIEFDRPEDCPSKRVIKDMRRTIFGNVNFSGLSEFGAEERRVNELGK